jgi:predicted Zn-dependent protease
MPATYEPIATTTLSSSQSTITFSSIPSTYTDLVLVMLARDTRSDGAGDGLTIRFNSDSGTNYSWTYLRANGSTTYGDQNSNKTSLDGYEITAAQAAANTFGTQIWNIMNYSNTTTFKTVTIRGGNPYSVDAAAGLYRSTSAISSIVIYPGFAGSSYSFVSGCSFTLYGIKAA